MTRLHICNTFLEWELSHNKKTTLKLAFEAHPVFLQLQYLPFLYAPKEDHVLVSHPVHSDFFSALKKHGIDPPSLHLISSPIRSHFDSIESWGASYLIRKWAEQSKILYEMPDWEVVSRVNSKAFSFQSSLKLPGAALIHNQNEMESWIRSIEGPKVLKNCLGVSGKGHFHLLSPDMNGPHLHKFAMAEWQAGRPLIGEPWVRRLFDFSTQWELTRQKEIRYIGAVLCENDPKGKYRSNSAGDEKKLFRRYLPFLEEQKKSVRPILQSMIELGYFGNVGIDAMIYASDQEAKLHPVVEINARKTMGFAALQMHRLHFSNKTISISYVGSKENREFLLPPSLLQSPRNTLSFPKNLALGIS